MNHNSNYLSYYRQKIIVYSRKSNKKSPSTSLKGFQRRPICVVYYDFEFTYEVGSTEYPLPTPPDIRWKCRCGAVEFPVLPDKPICCPSLTSWPDLTFKEFICIYH